MNAEPRAAVQKIIPLILLGSGLVLVFASALYTFRTPPPQVERSAIPIEVEYPAPELTLADVHGESRSLADYRGRVVLVNLWATWCVPCKEEMPALQEYHDKYESDGFTVIAVNDGDPAAAVVGFVKEFEITFPVWLDPAYIATEEAFKTMNLPSSFVIDRSGLVRLYWVGAINERNLERSVTPIIREAP